MKKRKKITSFCMAAILGISSMSGILSSGSAVYARGSDSTMAALARKAAEESIVLMENNGVLPFTKQTSISFFANGEYYMSGDGSGQTRATDEDKVTIEEGLKNSSVFSVKHTISDYRGTDADTVIACASDTDAAVIQISRSSGEGRDRSLSKGDWYLTDEETEMMSKVSDAFDKVVVVLNTTGVIDMAWVETYKPDAVVYAGTPGQQGGNAVADILSGAVNPSGKLVDTWASFESYASTANYDAYILDTETYTVDEDTEKRYPYWGSAPNPATGYDNGTHTRPIDEYMYTKYEEGIYVGYRWFDTFEGIVDGLADSVYYPFGYGLSYTNFDIHADSFRYDTSTPSTSKNDQKIKLEVTVENTGNTAGKEVVEVYYNAPDVQIGNEEVLENPSMELAAYEKTDLLAPGEKQTLTLSFDIKDMASWHEGIASYVLGAGTYNVYIGDSLADAKQRKAGSYTLALGGSNLDYQEVEKLSNLAGPDMKGGVYEKYREEYGSQITLTELSKYNYEETKPDDSECVSISDVTLTAIPGPGQGNRYDEYNGSSDYSAELLAEIARVKELDDAQYKLMDVYNKTVDMDTYLDQWEPLELIAFIEGAGNTGQMFDESAGLHGGASSTQAIPRLGVNSFRLADGPGQVGGSDENGYSTAWPTATNLAMTWNEDLMEEIGDAYGKEALEQDTDFWLAPSLNIHRNPLCGRNYEYFSEDPLISGTMTAALVRGAQAHGVSVAIKHFAGNSTEIERWNNYDSIMSERTLREIYLKGFEIAVKTSDPWGLMSAYGQLNGIHCSKNEELFQILKDEWGFTGAIMIDWEGDFGNTVGTILAGNNGLFPAQKGMTSYLWQAWTVSEAGGALTKTTAATKEEIGLALTRESLENAAEGMLNVMLRLKGFADDWQIAYSNPYQTPAAWFEAVKSEIVKAPEKPTKPDTDTENQKQTLKQNDKFLTKDFQYQLTDAAEKTVTIVKGINKKATSVNIPAVVAVNGEQYKVAAIGADAFKDYKKLRKAVIGENVTSIGNRSFYGCKKLKNVIIKGKKIKTIKSNAFKKVNSKIKVKLPKQMNAKMSKKVTKMLKKAGIKKIV